jgi:hypothetical protein
MNARPLSALLSALLIAAATLPACSSGSSSSGGSAGTPGDYVASSCARLSRCFVDFGSAGGPSATVDGFVLSEFDKSFLEICSDAARVEGNAELAYDLALPDIGAVDTAAIVRTLETASCEANPEVPMPKGSRAAGRECLSDLQCATGACSDRNGECGTCVTSIPTGSACVESDTTRQCADGSCENGVCRGDSQKYGGESCASSNECATFFGLQCVAGKCTSVVAGVGESCATKQCRGSVCDETTKLCVARKQSGACTSSSECDLFGGFACSATTKTCVKFTGKSTKAKAGEACGAQQSGGSFMFVECAAGLACVEDKCVSAASTCTAN